MPKRRDFAAGGHPMYYVRSVHCNRRFYCRTEFRWYGANRLRRRGVLELRSRSNQCDNARVRECNLPGSSGRSACRLDWFPDWSSAEPGCRHGVAGVAVFRSALNAFATIPDRAGAAGWIDRAHCSAPISHKSSILGQKTVIRVSPFRGLELRMTVLLTGRQGSRCNPLDC